MQIKIFIHEGYKSEYDPSGRFYYKDFDPKGNPHLLDALFTGCTLPYAVHSINAYTPEIEEDIKTIVKLTPQSIHCILGRLRCRNEVPPLGAACANPNIPIDIIKFLLEKGADPNATWKLNGERIRIIDDLYTDFHGTKDEDYAESMQRVKQIEELFKKYGLKD
jgi:ankyrin repeat protein